MMNVKPACCQLHWFNCAEGANFELVGFHNADFTMPSNWGQQWFLGVAKNFHSWVSSTEEGYVALAFAIEEFL